MQYNTEEKVFLIYLFVLSFLILLTPLISINWIGTVEEGKSLFIWNNASLFKVWFIILISLCVLIGWNINVKIRNMITIVFWFKENPFLLNFWLLRTILTAYVWIGETLSLTKEITTRIDVTKSYYIIVLLLLAWLIFTLYLTLQQAKVIKYAKNIHVREDMDTSTQKKDLDWLFWQLKQEHKKID